jgi:hypothetical protein
MVVDGYDTLRTTWPTIIDSYNVLVHPWSCLLGNISVKMWGKASQSVFVDLRDLIGPIIEIRNKLLYQIHRGLPSVILNTGPTGLLQSVMVFEDVLGRVSPLPYEFFQNQEVSTSVRHWIFTLR